jgi:hypothetical protein
MKIFKIIALIFPFFMNAQISFPSNNTNPVWRVEKGNFFADLYTGNYTLGNDDVRLNNRSYKEIISSFPPNFSPTVEGYIRTEGKKVYIITVKKFIVLLYRSKIQLTQR